MTQQEENANTCRFQRRIELFHYFLRQPYALEKSLTEADKIKTLIKEHEEEFNSLDKTFTNGLVYISESLMIKTDDITKSNDNLKHKKALYDFYNVCVAYLISADIMTESLIVLTNRMEEFAKKCVEQKDIIIKEVEAIEEKRLGYSEVDMYRLTRNLLEKVNK